MQGSKGHWVTFISVVILQLWSIWTKAGVIHYTQADKQEVCAQTIITWGCAKRSGCVNGVWTWKERIAGLECYYVANTYTSIQKYWLRMCEWTMFLPWFCFCFVLFFGHDTMVFAMYPDITVCLATYHDKIFKVYNLYTKSQTQYVARNVKVGMRWTFILSIF